VKTYLELIREREAEIEAEITEPADGRIIASTDFVRALISEFRERGKAVYRDLDTNVYVFDGVVVEPSGALPKGCFVIELVTVRETKQQL